MQIFAGKKFENPIKIIKAFDNESFIEAFSEIEKSRNSHFLLGYIRYDAKEIFLGNKIKTERPLLYFEVFESGQEYAPQNHAEFYLEKTALIDYPTYKKAIARIKKEIEEGNTYEVNYTYDWKIKTSLGGFALYESILTNQTTPYNAYIKNEWDEVLSFSPELFFELENDIIKTKPMKGTVKRGETELEDKANIEFLKNDIKNRAENVMIVDLLRNDLGKIAKTGTVKVDKLFEIETHKSLHQMTSSISAELEKGTTLYDIFEVIFPCGSITGAPKISTMEIIDEVELGKREIYCGAIGLITPEKTVFSVPIRMLQKKTDEDFYFCRVGGAIVWDSTAKEEWDETLTKIKFLQNNYCRCEQSEAIQVKPFGLPRRSFAPPRKDEHYFKLVETMLVQNGKIVYKKEHFNRMKKSAKELGFKFNKELLNLKSELPPIPTLTPQGGSGQSIGSFILRITMNREGHFETEYLLLNSIVTNKIIISSTPVDSAEPLLYHKTTCRPWYTESLEKIRRGEIFDEIFLNEKGELTEGSRSNLVLQLDGKLFTPPLECGALSGVLRQSLISKLIEKKLYLQDLKRAEKIFCINSVRGMVEVKLEEEL